MYFSNESLLVIVIVGIIAGWLAGQIVRGGGFGLIGDLIIGVLGVFIGDWLFPRLNIDLGAGTVALIINLPRDPWRDRAAHHPLGHRQGSRGWPGGGRGSGWPLRRW